MKERLHDASWSFNAGPPQRYTVNYSGYLARGGMARPCEDMLRFAPDGKGSGDSGRFWFFCLLLDQLAKEGLEGDLAEVGVYQGHTAALLTTIARRLGRTAYLFDTFEGFADADLTGMDAGRLKHFNDTSLEAVRAHVGEIAAQYVKGYFPESATQIRADLSFSLVHIDCDLYAPIKSALEYFYPRMVPGGFIVVHDYSSLGWAGAEKAVDDFFADKVESIVPLPDSAGSIVVRRAKAPGGQHNWRIRQTRKLFTGKWIDAGNNALGSALGTGWSGPEDWGVWGIGPVHEFEFGQFPGEVIILDADAHAFLPGPNLTQDVDILVGNDVVARWIFTPSANRSVRSARIPLMDTLAASRGEPSLVKVQFRLRELHPNSDGERPLGMAIHRVRITKEGEGRMAEKMFFCFAMEGGVGEFYRQAASFAELLTEDPTLRDYQLIGVYSGERQGPQLWSWKDGKPWADPSISP